MQFISTNQKDSATIEQAIIQGLANDGGLYVPTQFPDYDVQKFLNLQTLPEFALALFTPFFSSGKIKLNLKDMEAVFSPPMPLHPLRDNQYVLELFHGPTLSFKDFGARFFAYCLNQLSENTPRTVLVATSGDTGSAVASAFFDKPNIRTFILFPYQKITQRQQHQITCWGGSIHPLAITGTFDDCQKMVKSAIANPELHKKYSLTTANSINIARLLPQVLFYAYTSVQFLKKGVAGVNFIVPSGNLGNVTACYWAKQMGFPIHKILIATNANQVLSDYLNTGVYHPKTSIATLANAMDVGNPSNLARLEHLFQNFPTLQKNLDVEAVNDDLILQAIRHCYQHQNYLICPHTATAYHRLLQIKDDEPWIIAATAHPAKFETILERTLNVKIPVPQRLALMLKKEEVYEILPPLDAELSAKIKKMS